VELLVSVRSAGEVKAALSGGAQIIDAKEPARGSLGAVSAHDLVEILAEVPEPHAVSVALGDWSQPEQLGAAIASLPIQPRLTPVYLKLGFAGVARQQEIERVIGTAVSVSSKTSAPALIVAVAYADAESAGTPSPDRISEAASRAGAVGLLLDTHRKDGRSLLAWMSLAALTQWVNRARNAGLMTALAGALQLEDLDLIRETGADIVGVRGAACEGGREGRVSAARVRALRKRLMPNSGSVQGVELPGPEHWSRNA
jgi:(5-formylfuran-3-yl)methyl phosphate synthase